MAQTVKVLNDLTINKTDLKRLIEIERLLRNRGFEGTIDDVVLYCIQFTHANKFMDTQNARWND